MSSTVTKTIDDCVLEARQMVNDSTISAQRNPDSVFIQYLNSALRAVYSVRPDAFIGNFTQGIISTIAVVTYTTSDLQDIDGVPNTMPPVPATPFPCDDKQFFNPVVGYVAARVELADDEYTETSRSAQLMAAFLLQLRGM